MAIVESVVSFLVEWLGDQLIREINLLRDERNQIEWVRREFRRMECFLKDMDIGRVDENDRVKNWRQEVRDSAYRAEDIIDIFFLAIAPLRRHGFLGTIKRYACICSELMARRELLSEVETIKIDLESITASRARYGFENMGGRGEAISGGGGGRSSQQNQRERRLTAPHVEEPDFTGFDGDVKTLIQRLTQGEQRRCVIGVVGMGGLGKTTLARNVYKSVAVQKYFHPCVWISVSQVYAAKELLQAVIRSCMSLSEDDQKKVGRMNTGELSGKIAEYLAGKKYIIVLDDMWTPDAWDELKDAIPDGNDGSRVLLTTRNKDVALHADARSEPHELRFLTEAESWELFCKKAFPGRNASFSDGDMEKQGREMVRKCGGLPLAIVVIGGLLSRKEPREWENVYKSINWQFVEGQVQISWILSLSYKDLPYDLKPCFLYLGTFPEDYEFPAKKLVKLWAAEGFLHQRGEEMVEKVGEDCLKELIRRSLVQVARTSAMGAIKSCKIHDLLRDLCISEAKEERFLEIDGGHKTNRVAPSFSRGRARRLAIHHGRKYFCLRHAARNLHSLVIHGQDEELYGRRLGRRQEKLLGGNFKLLRVLDLNKVRMQNLPSEIGEVIHLRYLSCLLVTTKRSITRSIIELEHVFAEVSLPSSIGNLTNLQTLLIYSVNNVKIPSTIEKLKQLRHLEIKISKEMQVYRDRIGVGGVIKGKPRLHSMSHDLCSLANVWAGKWLYKDCLREMKNLRKLGICLYSKKGECVGKEEWESIVGLKFLESLLVSSVNPRNREKNSQLKLVPLNHLHRLSKLCLLGKLEKPPESSCLPLNLTKLTLRLSCLEQDPLPVLEKLENLQVLKLQDSAYLGKEMACSAGGFSQLKSLNLEYLNELEQWRVEQGSMPLVSFLRISGCTKLKMVPEGLQHVTSLKTLELLYMGRRFHDRVTPDTGEDWHKVQHIPSIDVRRLYPIEVEINEIFSSRHVAISSS
ncbi:hypothetical protein ACLOJK_039939 [Asimina triloba]